MLMITKRELQKRLHEMLEQFSQMLNEVPGQPKGDEIKERLREASGILKLAVTNKEAPLPKESSLVEVVGFEQSVLQSLLTQATGDFRGGEIPAEMMFWTKHIISLAHHSMRVIESQSLRERVMSDLSKEFLVTELLQTTSGLLESFGQYRDKVPERYEKPVEELINSALGRD